MAGTGRRPYAIRIVLLIAGFVLWNGGILLRLAQKQVLEHDEYARLALQRQQTTRAVNAPRGIIYDSNMDEIATTVAVRTVVAEPRRISDVPAAARRLAEILDLDPEELTLRMTDPDRQTYMVVKRRIDPSVEELIEGLGIFGIYLVEESMRAYPNRELASHVLGFVNMNGDGGAGVELQYDQELKGTPGLVSFDVDARRRSFRGRIEKPPVQGHSLVLSVHKSLQYIAEREIVRGVARSGAAAGTVIMMEPDTGRILALANYPDFNCNAYNEYDADRWRNRAVSDLYEPGSTFKVVVASAALEAGIARPDEIVDCQMGSIRIGGHSFRDHKPYGLLSFRQVLEFSSNVGAAKMGLRLGEQRLHEAIVSFGFGARTGIDLPGEIVGLVRPRRQWSALSIGAISFGQEVGVSALQILLSINAIANGGYLVRPTVADRLIDADNNVVHARTVERRRVLSPETAAIMREAFEGVVLRGTGKRAALEGYRAAGKTGTAQKIVDGRYSRTRYLAAFAGFAPLPNPKLTILVHIDEPRGAIYGGEVAAPIFRRIAQEALLVLKVPPDPTLPTPEFDPRLASADAMDFLPDATPVPPMPPADQAEVKEARPEFISVRAGAAMVVMPDFRGLAKREVLLRCQDLGIQMHAEGSGRAVTQEPPPGARVAVGDRCSVTFARATGGRRVKAALRSGAAAPTAGNGAAPSSNESP